MFTYSNIRPLQASSFSDLLHGGPSSRTCQIVSSVEGREVEVGLK